MVPLSIDIKQYIHIFSEGILRSVHVRVAEARVMRAGMLIVQHPGMMAHPPGLIRTYFHRSVFISLNSVFFTKCSCAPKQIGTSQKRRNNQSQIRFALNPQVPRLFPITWRQKEKINCRINICILFSVHVTCSTPKTS